MPFQTPVTIAKALEKIHRHDYVLPAIQREFVWQTDQISRLFDSLMQGYPIGSFLFWKVNREHSHDYVFYEFMTNYHQRKSSHLKRLELMDPREITAILDGQQRLTALNMGLRGSYAQKLPYKWVDNLSAYPVKFLYLNLKELAAENELGMVYDFRFLTKERVEAETEGDPHWFSVSKIVLMQPGIGIYDYLREADLISNSFAFHTLTRLYDVVHRDLHINYYEEDSQDLDKVLNIFIRVNSGGTTLSYSDLLLSIATAQWKEVEAREVIHALVDELNETGQHFKFSKDVVLKTGLVLTDTPSIAFRVTNFNATNMSALENSWSSIARTLRLGVRLLADFGFSERTLTSYSVVIPLAYYLHKRGLQDSYLSSDATQADREKIRGWVIKSLLKPGIWGSSLDTLILALRSVIQDYGANGFPLLEIEAAMTKLGKSLRFEEDEIQDLLSISYDDKRAFPLLSLSYPGMDFRNEFHVDHIFPTKRFWRASLAVAGIGAFEQDELITRSQQLPNLQLLEGAFNTAKQDKLPLIWISSHFPDEGARAIYCMRHDLGSLPQDISGFSEFFEARQNSIGFKLRKVLGITAP